MPRILMPLLALVFWLAASGSALADNVDDLVKALMAQQHVPGVSIAVIKDGTIVKAAGYGSANLEHGVAARPDTVYKIGSVSKQFIAAGILLLIQDGKVALDDPLGTYLVGTPDTWKDITIRHALTHTTGIVREAPGFHPYKVQSDAEVIKTAYSLPLRFTPGEKWEYCNVGYFALAEIIRIVSGKPWEEYLRERIFAPLGMNATRTTSATTIVAGRADGYDWDQGQMQNAGEWLALRPSGALLSTVLDLAKWDAALDTDRLLQRSLRDQMFAPVKLNAGTTHPYGFGWNLDTVDGHRVVRHGGSLPGFRATLGRFVDDKLTVIVLTNGDDANADAFLFGIAELYIPGFVRRRAATPATPARP